MTAHDQPDSPNFDEIPQAIIDSNGEHKGFPIVWLLPLIALLIGGWLLQKTLAESGPDITISFQTAEGIEADKTPIKYRDVTIGHVQKIRFSDDLANVIVSAQLIPGMETHLSESTRFWVVRPRVGAGGISGLGTLLSGAHIAMDPGNENNDGHREFIGLENPPAITTDEQGTIFQLKASRLGSLSVGSPVYFRQIKVGEVTQYELSDNHDAIEASIFVQAPHDLFVRTGTVFWEVGGLDLSMSASGVKLEMESLLALANGGVAFETPAAFSDSLPASDGREFPLYANRTESLEQPITRSFPYMLRFTDTVRGLETGAEVEFRGIRIGTVTRIEARLDVESGEFLIPVHINIEPDRWLSSDNIDPKLSIDEQQKRLNKSLEFLVSKGLRGRLQTGSLLTGQLYVEFDLHPESKDAELSYDSRYPELPVIPGQFASIAAALNKLLARLDNTPLEQTLANLNQFMISTSALAATLESDIPSISNELKMALAEARSTLKSANDTLASIKDATGPDSQIGNTLHKTLSEVRNAARSIRVMADYLERHPEALLRGKDGR